MRLRRDILGVAVVIGALAAYWIGSEIHYSRSISPKGISTVAEYFHRFGEPRVIREVGRDGKTYYEFFGRGWPSWRR